jgi:chromosomal replication initiation ATPase DnaA
MKLSFYSFPGIALPGFNAKIERVIDRVSYYTGVSKDKICNKDRPSRVRYIVQARSLCWLIIAEKHKEITLKAVGEYFGGFHHTTVLSAKQTIKNYIDTDPEVKTLYQSIRLSLQMPEFINEIQ